MRTFIRIFILISGLTFGWNQCNGCNQNSYNHYLNFEIMESIECIEWITIIEDCNQSDLNILQSFINNSTETINMDMDHNNNGIVEPLELGLQEWTDGRLTSIMCGAYIYCQLSGDIPEVQESQLTEIEQFRFEYNYLSGYFRCCYICFW